jgi:thioredoxin-like negative regulator of GroEL
VNLAPAVREAARMLAGKGALVQINVDESPVIAGRFGIRGVPAFVALKGGRSVGSLQGARPAAEIVRWFLGIVA